MDSPVLFDNEMIEEEKSEVMDDDLQIVRKSHGELKRKFQDEGYGGESYDEEETNKKRLLKSNASASNFSKDRWIEILEEVQPIASILLSDLPTIAVRYKLIIVKLKATIRDLPLSQDLLPMHIKFGKSTIKLLQRQKKKNLWENYTNSVELEELENSLKLLFSLMVSIAIELKINSAIIRSYAKYAIKPNSKQDDKNTHTPIEKEMEQDNKNKLITNYDVVDENRWIDILEEVQPIAPILIKKFPKLVGQYRFLFEDAKIVIRGLPYSKYQLPSIARSCKRNFKHFQNEKKKGLWNDLSNISVELQQLENTLMFLFSKVVSIAVELKIELVRKPMNYKRLLLR